MSIDCNAFLGHWPFRPLRSNDVPGLLGMMDRFAIERACVASADAVLYRDCHAGNRRLFEETRVEPERFWCYATLNPVYAGWERDLAACVDVGFVGARLYPHYHDYALDGPEAARFIDAATEAGLAITIPMRMEDLRQRHWMDTELNLDLDTVVCIAEKHSNATLVLTEALFSAGEDDPIWERMRDAGLYVEMSRMTSVLQNNLGLTIRKLGTERVLFGTGFPFKTPSPAFLKVEALRENRDVEDLILGENARRLFERTALGV